MPRISEEKAREIAKSSASLKGFIEKVKESILERDMKALDEATREDIEDLKRLIWRDGKSHTDEELRNKIREIDLRFVNNLFTIVELIDMYEKYTGRDCSKERIELILPILRSLTC